MREYILKRENLYCLFVLVDIRHKAQTADLEFMEWLGLSGIPFVIVFTKADKLKPEEREENLGNYTTEMLKTWETMPDFFVTSSATTEGKEEILQFIEKVNKLENQ